MEQAPWSRRATYTLYGITMTLPRVVTGPGKYVTRGGAVVNIDRLGGYNNFKAYGSYPNGTAEMWYVSGRVLPYSLSENDIVRAF